MSDDAAPTTGARGMTAGDWRRLKLPMEWGTFLSYVPGEPDKCFLDLRTDAPDGTHDVAIGEGPAVSGVVVGDGLFEPIATAHACYEAAARGLPQNPQARTGATPMTKRDIAERKPLDRPLISLLDWNAKKERFQLTTST